MPFVMILSMEITYKILLLLIIFLLLGNRCVGLGIVL
jgi:hypothetical protein